jgi:hypothetical protein
VYFSAKKNKRCYDKNMGRPSVPLEVKRLTGNPGQRRLPDEDSTIAVKGGYVQPHQPLEWAGQQLWDRVFSQGQTWVANTDVEALMIVCKQLDRQVRIEAMVLEKPDDFHLLRQLLEIEKAIMNGLAMLGFTVDSRSKLGLAEIKAESMFQKLMSERA